MLHTWLRYLVDASLADAIAGDLEEERRRRQVRSPAAARLWFLMAILGLISHMAARRLADALRSSRASFSSNGRGEWRRTVRSLARAPWFSATALGLLALTLTLAVTTFSIVDGALFTTLRYPAGDRLFLIQPGFTKAAPRADRSESMSPADISAWMAADPTTRITGYSASNFITLGDGVNEPLFGLAAVAPDFFDVLDVRPSLGGFAPEDFQPGAAFEPLIISDEIWRARFGGDPAVVGRRLVLDPVANRGYRIAGVMPAGFVFPSDRVRVDAIMPIVNEPNGRQNPRARSIAFALARLGAGATAASLGVQIAAGMAEVARTFPPLGPRPARASDTSWVRQGPFDRADVVPLGRALGRRDRPLLLAVFWASVVLVLLAAINVSGLLVVRVVDRSHEFLLRRALGASAAGLARLLLMEALTLMLAAAAIAIAAARPFLQFVLTLLPENLVLFKAPTIDGWAIGLTALSSLMLGIAATTWPIVRALRCGRTPPSGDSGRASTRAQSVGRTLFVASQIGGALVLTVAGALVVGSMLRVYADAPPLQTHDVAVIQVWSHGPGARMRAASPERTAQVAAAIDRLRRIPGLAAVSADSAQILAGGDEPYPFQAPPGASNDHLVTYAHGVTGDFFRTVGLPAVAGRLPTDAESRSGAPFIVVSESVARAYWPDGSALGRTLTDNIAHVAYTVIGVCPDVRWTAWDQEASAIYGPFDRFSQFPWTTIFARTNGDIRTVTAAALQAIGQDDPLLSPAESSTLDALFLDSVRPRRFRAWLFGSFAVAALLIIGVGVLGLLAMTTAHRTREMGIRLALGATPNGVIRLFLTEQLPGVAAGLIAGGVISAWAVRFVSAYLYQLTVYDARVWTIAVVLILGVAAAGAIMPARRAGRVDPVIALRAE